MSDLKPKIYTLNAVYLPQGVGDTEPSESTVPKAEQPLTERPIFILSSGGTSDLVPSSAKSGSNDAKPIICLDNEVYIPATGCTDCEELEYRVRKLEECCAEVQAILENIPTYSAGANINISDQGVISATDTTYTAGQGINIVNGVISATGSMTKEQILTALGYEEVSFTMTDTLGNTVTRTVIAQITP